MTPLIYYLFPGWRCSPEARGQCGDVGRRGREGRELADGPVFPGGPGKSMDGAAAFGGKERDGVSAQGRGHHHVGFMVWKPFCQKQEEGRSPSTPLIRWLMSPSLLFLSTAS